MPSHTDEIKPPSSPEQSSSGDKVAVDTNAELPTLTPYIHHKNHGEIRLSKALSASIGLHFIAPVALLVSILLLAWVFHWDIWHSKPENNDVAFTLVLDTHAPKPKKALYKGPHNQIAGGHSKPQSAPKPKTVEVAKATPIEPHPKASPKAQTTPKEVSPTPPKKSVVEPHTESVTIKKPEEVKPQTDPTKSETATQPETPNNQPPKDTPNDTQSMAQNGPSNNDGVNVSEDVDFGPFMADLEKRIKLHWVPPRGSESRKVRLMLFLQRDGRLLKVETLVSSGDQNTDLAAVAAAEASAPFMVFPEQIHEDVLPVEFTFDYNVLNSPKRKEL
jgi:outer membrane biosynthesis protein TonB